MQIKKILLYFISAMVIHSATIMNIHAQVSRTPTLLWAVFSKGDSIPSFIYGTIHHLGPKAILSNKKLLNIILMNNMIVLEADTNEFLHPQKIKFDYRSNIALDQLLSMSDYSLVKDELYNATGLDIETYKNMMPQMVMQLILEGRESRNPSADNGPIMENAFYALCKVKGIPIAGLETHQDMYNITYKGMPPSHQAGLLMQYLKGDPFNTTETNMLPCYEQQDLNCLCNIDDMKNYTRPGDSALIMNRNIFWLPKIEKYLKQKKIFIAVGAAHLCGDYGIVALLKRKGYMLIPMKL